MFGEDLLAIYFHQLKSLWYFDHSLFRTIIKCTVIFFLQFLGWSRSTEQALLSLYIGYHDDKKRWEKIADDFFNLTNVKKDKMGCRLKIKTLRERYRKKLKHNNTPGNLLIRIDKLLEEAFSQEVMLHRPLIESPGTSVRFWCDRNINQCFFLLFTRTKWKLVQVQKQAVFFVLDKNLDKICSSRQ